MIIKIILKDNIIVIYRSSINLKQSHKKYDEIFFSFDRF